MEGHGWAHAAAHAVHHVRGGKARPPMRDSGRREKPTAQASVPPMASQLWRDAGFLTTWSGGSARQVTS
jgi:hypothetical protein